MSTFSETLASLADDADTLAALMVDESGETVAIESDGSLERDLPVLAAYLSIRMRRLRGLGASTGSYDVLRFQVEHEKAQILAAALPDGYVLAVVQAPESITGRSWARLEAARGILLREAFTR
jgi:hypothetical protein